MAWDWYILWSDFEASSGTVMILHLKTSGIGGILCQGLVGFQAQVLGSSQGQVFVPFHRITLPGILMLNYIVLRRIQLYFHLKQWVSPIHIKLLKVRK